MGSEEARRRIDSGAAWEQFCEQLKGAGKITMRPETPSGELDRAEGWRYLSRLTRMALEVCFENSDPDFPTLLNIPHATAKAGADNPGILYFTAAVAGDRQYRLHGTRGTVSSLSFATRSLIAESGSAVGQTAASTTGELEGKDLLLSPDGRFEIAVCKDPRPGNWLPLDAGSNVLTVRQTFLDKSQEVPATVSIQKIGGARTPEPLSARRADWALRAAADMVGRIALRYAEWAKWYQVTPNTLKTVDGSPLREEVADPNLCYLHGFWTIGPEEALVIHTAVPPCAAWTFQVNNYWMESLDYRYHQIWVNKRTARYNPDGSVTLVIAASDPGVGNYLDTAGHSCGTMVLRWIRAEHHPVPVCRIEKLAALRASVAT